MLREPLNMHKLCVVFVMCCASVPLGRAAPRTVDPDRGSQLESGGAEQNDWLQEETDGHEGILSKLLGDYDKVKALSEGSDCRCKCVVRPLSRSACRRIEAGSASAQDFYTVETITSGPQCKCACLAPPSAVNPCEGEFRLKKLREAGKENVKLSTILELLEGSFYGMDLLKLHSITSKLLDRVDHIEKVVSLNNTSDEVKAQESPPIETAMTESPPTPPPIQHQDKKALGEGINGDTFLGENPDSSAQITEVISQVTPKHVANKEALHASKSGPNGMIIRGMTFYKSEPDPMVADDGEPGENLFEYDGFSGDGTVNLFIEENLLQHRAPRPRVRAGPRSFQPKTVALIGLKKTSQSRELQETEHTSESQHDVTSATEAIKSLDVATDVQSDGDAARRFTVRPTTTTKTTGTTDNAAQTIQKITAGIIEWPIYMMDEPSSSSKVVTTKERTRTTINTSQPSEKTTTEDTLTSSTTTNAPTTMMESSTLDLKDQIQTTPESTAAGPSRFPPNPTMEMPGFTTTITTPAAPTLALVQPTNVSTEVSPTTPEVESESTMFVGSTLPLTTQSANHFAATDF
ncbi:hypothetical protein Q5P01_016099 [Channa striata]|uniref:Olfactomedin-like protein 2B n=1 Tax=Channa striata TaxID=64152 RepID=A0AA88SFB5_CHASR|nr:hypothetical protein Q5P01_016099 [Channa striata]